MVEVVVTDDFTAWYQGLDDQDSDAVQFSVSLLESRGVGLGAPHSSAIMGASFALRELRIQSRGKPIRVFYAFDPKRQAVLLIGGKKADDSFYDEMIPIAERVWREYLAETK